MEELINNKHISLCDTLDRLLNTGVVVKGELTISVVNIDLLYLDLGVLLTSIETMNRMNRLKNDTNNMADEGAMKGR